MNFLSIFSRFKLPFVSSAVPSLPVVSVDNLADHLKNRYQEGNCLDDGRDAFIRDTCDTLTLLVSDGLGNANGFRRLLLGRKGVGKTSLLKFLVNNTQYLGGKLISIYLGLDIEYITPLQAINKGLKKLGFHVAAESIDQLCDWLRLNNKCIFLVIDEFQLAYTAIFKSNDAIQQTHLIGGLSGLIHCIISGSSSELRKLAFCKVARQDLPHMRDRYPNYIDGVDLNSTKYKAKWIHPILDEKSFKEMVRLMWKQTFNTDLDYKDLAEDQYFSLLLNSGGYPRVLSDLIAHKSFDERSYSAQLRIQLNDTQRDILHHLYNVLGLKGLDSEKPFEMNAVLMRYIPLRPTDATSEDLYRLADDGIVRFIDGKDEYAFGTPTIYAEFFLQLHQQQRFTLRHLIAMSHPRDSLLEAAEEVAFMCLADAAKALGLTTTTVKYDRSKLNLLLPGTNPSSSSSSSSSDPQLYGTSISSLCGHVWKETIENDRDALGADAVLFSYDEKAKCLTVHRIQIKLGKGVTRLVEQLKKAKEVVNKFKTGFPEAKRRYECGISKGITLEFRQYLLSSNQVAPDVIDYYQKIANNSDRETDYSFHFRVFSRQELKTHVWPKVIQEIHDCYS